jgi:release factor glutamine methyltransferase
MSAPDCNPAAAKLARMNRFHEATGLLPQLLEQAGIADAQGEARELLRALARPDGMSFDAFLRAAPSGHPALLDRLTGMVLRRMRREPLDRIVGSRGFWTLDIALTPATLSPRPDTETLVEAVLRQAAIDDPGASRPLRILDLGTGSGAILLALLADLPRASGLGIDLSGEAVEAAKANLIRNAAIHPDLGGRADFRSGDWFSGITERFDIIVSNPPYIASSVIAGLDPEVRAHDPLLSLDGGPDGLDAYRRILGAAAAFLTPSGFIAVEIGFDQAEAVSALGRSCGLSVQRMAEDLGGNPRVVQFGPG